MIDYTPLLKPVGKWPRESLFDRLESCIAMLSMNGYLGQKQKRLIYRRLLRDRGRGMFQQYKKASKRNHELTMMV